MNPEFFRNPLSAEQLAHAADVAFRVDVRTYLAGLADDGTMDRICRHLTGSTRRDANFVSRLNTLVALVRENERARA